MEELGRFSADENLLQHKHDVVLVLDNIRSGHNVGSILRTADAMGVKKIYLCGICPVPPDRQVIKASLGAENSVSWEKVPETTALLDRLKKDHSIWIVEQTKESEVLGTQSDHGENKTLALVFGNEVNGVNEALLPYADKCLEVPQIGHKHSLNVAVCTGMVLWEIVR